MPRNDVSKMKSELQRVIAQAEQVLKDAGEATASGAESLRERASRRIAQARERLDELEDTAIARTRAAASRSNAYAHDNPWLLVGVAAAVAFMVGWATPRNRH